MGVFQEGAMQPFVFKGEFFTKKLCKKFKFGRGFVQ